MNHILSDSNAVFYSKSADKTRKRPATDWLPISADGNNNRCRFHGRGQHFRDGGPSATSDFQTRPLADPVNAAAACHIVIAVNHHIILLRLHMYCQLNRSRPYIVVHCTPVVYLRGGSRR